MPRSLFRRAFHFPLRMLTLAAPLLAPAIAAEGPHPVALEAPFWRTPQMTNESVMMIDEGRGPEARLLFEPLKILSVRNSALTTTYTEGVDWEYREGRLRLLPGSSAPALTHAQMYPTTETAGQTFARSTGGYVLFSEGHFFHDRQLAVTYTHAPDAWHGPAPQFDAAMLPKTIDRLRQGQPLKVVLFGDSILQGANASGLTGAPPLMPIWGDLLIQCLRAHYASTITCENPSVGGQTSAWGATMVDTLVASRQPDLVVIHFGLNDLGALTATDYQANLQTIMNKVHAMRPDCEFMLVAPIRTNPEVWDLKARQDQFRAAEKELAGPGRPLVDMTSIHDALLGRKRYCDMTGNNVNHPNDFLCRWYFHAVSALLVPPSPATTHPIFE